MSQTDNPGPWIMHCHIDFHLALGFAVVLAEAPRDVPGYVSPIPSECWVLKFSPIPSVLIRNNRSVG